MTALPVWTIPSHSHPGRSHRVTLHPDGHLSCTCTAASYGRMCRHRMAVLTIEEAITSLPLPAKERPYARFQSE
jgi:hypothetical protein